MAAILQFRQGSKTSFITSGPYISEPFFDTDTNIIHIGVDGSSTITLTKLEDINSGSFSISGDFSGTNLSLSGDITASSANLSGDITIGGNIILGDQVQDTITVSGQFDSDLIPSESLQYSIGSQTKKWKHLYAESASIDSVNLVSNLPSGVVSSSIQVLGGSDVVSGSIAWNLNHVDILGNSIDTTIDRNDVFRITTTTSNIGITTQYGQVGQQKQIQIGFSPGDLGTTSSSTAYPYMIIHGDSTGTGYPSSTSKILRGDLSVLDFADTDGLVSSSDQILGGTDIVSSSQQVVDFLPSSVVSGSTQITDSSELVSSSQQVIDFLPTGVISGSEQVYYTEITGLPTLVSQSAQITNGSGILSSSIETFNQFSTSIDIRVGSLEGDIHVHSNKTELDTINQYLSTTSSVSFTSLQTSTQLEVGGNLEVFGTSSFDGNLTIYGDLTVFGSESIVNATNLSIADNMIYLNSGSTITNPDLGFAGNYNDGTYAHAGLFRDASDGGTWKFYQSYIPEPEGSIDTTHITFELAPLSVESLDVTLVTMENIIGTGSQLVFPGTNIVSSSQQVINFLPSGAVSSSIQITNGSSLVSSSQQVINFLPIGTVSGSIQITDGSNLVSSSQQVVEFLPLGTVSGSEQTLGGTDIVSSSQQVVDFLPSGVVSGSGQIQLILPQGTVSGSDQVTQSLDTRYLEINGDNILSSSNENFSDFSQSVDLRLLNTLSSGSETSQSLHILSGNFPTSGSLGTAAFYNVSSSLGDDPSVIPNVKAVFDYINNTIGAADITGVSASLGLSGGGDGGYVSLSLDTASAHFQAGVELYGTSQVEVVNILNDNNVISSSIQLNGENLNLGDITGSYIRGGTGHFTGVLEVGPYVTGGPPYIPSFYVNNDGDTSIRGTLQLGPVGHINDVSASISSINVLNTTQNNRLDSLELLSSSLDSNVSTSEIIIKNTDGTFTGSNSYADSNNLAVGTSSPSSIVGGLTQLTINDSNYVGTSGLLSFEDSGTTKSYDYVSSNVRYVDSVGGVSIAIKPDGDGTKAWVFDTDGDLVSNGGSWTSGNIYANNLIASSSVTASNMLVDNDIIANNFIGNIQSTNGVISGSSQVKLLLPDGTISGSSQITITESQISDLTHYTDSDVKTKLNVENVFSSSAQVTITESQISDLTHYTDSDVKTKLNLDGIFSGSSQIDVEQTTNYNQVVNLSDTQTIGGTKTFNDIVVNGTGSFAYFISTETELNTIGQSFIVLNNDTPTQRYAGLAVYDSGSAGVTASLQFDGQTNDWFYEYSDDGGVTTDHGVVMFGPEFSTKGSPTYNTNNTILKSNGGHHTLDSNITDDGSTITLGSNTTVSGVLSATTFAGMISGSTFTSPSQGNLDAVINGNTQSIDLGLQTTDDVTFGSIDVTNGSVDIRNTSPTLIIRNTDTTVIENQVLGEIKFLHSDADGGFAEVGIIKSVATEIFTGVDADSYKINIDSNTIVNGTLEATGDIIAYSSSDRRLKNNILPISNPLQKINSIGGYSFDWNVEKQHIYKGKDYGVIAQEIEEILPELVDTRENGYKAVKYDKLVSLLIEGIKELSHEVKELKEKINRE